MGRICEVLVVEDDDILGELVRDLLRGEGHRVTVARDYARALALLGHDSFDVVLLDSPGVPLHAAHWEAMGRVRERAGDTPIVLFTAHREADVADYAAHGFRAVVHKPFDVGDLLDAIERALPDDCEADPSAA